MPKSSLENLSSSALWLYEVLGETGQRVAVAGQLSQPEMSETVTPVSQKKNLDETVDSKEHRLMARFAQYPE